MDDNCVNIPEDPHTGTERAILRDENRSPTTSGESSGTADSLDDRKQTETQRRRRRKPAGRHKRRWKPNDELNWDQKSRLDDTEAKRAFAKRQRLSAEGHPIAPYNTTQFLMEDHWEDLRDREPGQPIQETVREPAIPANKGASCLDNLANDNEPQFPAIPKAMSTDSLIVMATVQSAEMLNAQEYILDDFSNEYEEIHAEQLQSLPKNDLVSECMHLERQVENLERKLKSCQRRHEREKRELTEQISELKSQL